MNILRHLLWMPLRLQRVEWAQTVPSGWTQVRTQTPPSPTTSSSNVVGMKIHFLTESQQGVECQPKCRQMRTERSTKILSQLLLLLSLYPSSRTELNWNKKYIIIKNNNICSWNQLFASSFRVEQQKITTLKNNYVDHICSEALLLTCIKLIQ